MKTAILRFAFALSVMSADTDRMGAKAGSCGKIRCR
jgi:hypothetical protein